MAGHSESKEAKNKGRQERKISIVSTNRGINNTGLSRMHSAVDRLSINQKKFLFSLKKKITILDDGAETRDAEISCGRHMCSSKIYIKYNKNKLLPIPKNNISNDIYLQRQAII